MYDIPWSDFTFLFSAIFSDRSWKPCDHAALALRLRGAPGHQPGPGTSLRRASTSVRGRWEREKGGLFRENMTCGSERSHRDSLPTAAAARGAVSGEPVNTCLSQLLQGPRSNTADTGDRVRLSYSHLSCPQHKTPSRNRNGPRGEGRSVRHTRVLEEPAD